MQYKWKLIFSLHLFQQAVYIYYDKEGIIMSKRVKADLKDSVNNNKKPIIIVVIAVLLIALAVIIGFAVAKSGKKDINDLGIKFPENSIVDIYTDENGREITKVTDENGNVKEYYINEDGYVVTRENESISDSEAVKIIENYDDGDGNHVKVTILPDGTTITETTDSKGQTNQSVKVPDSALTSYISYGDASKNEELKTPEITKLDYTKIVGYAPMYSSNDNSNIVYGLELPYTIGDTGMVIESIGSFIGPYVEDGSDEEVEDVAAMVVTNTTDRMIQYSALSFSAKKGNSVNFVITNLPAKTSMIVFDSNRTAFKGTEVLTFKEDKTAYTDRNMHESELTISTQDNLISLTNNTDKKIDTAYVYYKLYLDCGVFYGGITYRAKIENIEPGGMVTQGASHYFTNSSEVLSVDFAYAE